MSDARLRWLTVLVTAALLVVVGVGAVLGSSAAANNLQASAQTALANAGLDGVAVEFSGREATLSGGSHADLTEAQTIVEAIDGVRSARAHTGVDQRPTATAAPTPTDESGPSLMLRRTADGLTISGVVPDADAAAGIKSGAALIFGGTVTGDLSVDGSAGTAPWVAALPGLFGDLVGVRGLDLSIASDGQVQVGGTIESAAGRTKVVRLVKAAIPGVRVSAKLAVDPAGLSRADATALNQATAVFDQGSSVVTYAAVPALDKIASILQRNPRVKIQISGHAGSSDRTAESLAAQRVASVKAYLVAIGADAKRLSTKTYATGIRPADSDAEQYRRVDFIMKGN